MLSAPRSSLLDDVAVLDLHQRLPVGERVRIQIEAPQKEAAPIHGGDLGVQDRVGPLVDDDPCRQQATIQAPRRCAREQDVAAASEQQMNSHATPGGIGEGGVLPGLKNFLYHDNTQGHHENG